MPKRVHIFKSGTHTPMEGAPIEFTGAALDAIARNYDPALSEAPVVVGHPRTDAPAFGWVKGVSARDGNLYADLGDLDPDFADAVQEGRYRKISASFFPPHSPGNPVPGSYYLRHVGFLGAAAPAVKGLAPVRFADAGEAVTIEFAAPPAALSGIVPAAAPPSVSAVEREGEPPLRLVARMLRGLREMLIAEKGRTLADTVVPGNQIDRLLGIVETDGPGAPTAVPSPASAADPVTPPSPDGRASAPLPASPPPRPETETGRQEEKSPGPDSLEARRAALEAGERQLAAERAAISAHKAKAEAEAFLKPLVAAGKVLPAEEDGLIAFMAALDGRDTVEFADGGRRPSMEVLKDLLRALPRRVNYGEAAGADTGGAAASFAAAPFTAGSFTDATALAGAIRNHIAAEGEKGRTLSVSSAAAELTGGV